MIERCEETQAVIPMKQGLFNLHLPAWQRPAGRKALWAGQKLHPGGDFVFNCLQALFLCTWSCTHTVGLCGKKGIHVKDMCISLAWVFFSKNNPSKLSRNSYIDAIKKIVHTLEMKLVKRSPQIHKEKPQSLWDLSYALTSENLNTWSCWRNSTISFTQVSQKKKVLDTFSEKSLTQLYNGLTTCFVVWKHSTPQNKPSLCCLEPPLCPPGMFYLLCCLWCISALPQLDLGVIQAQLPQAGQFLLPILQGLELGKALHSCCLLPKRPIKRRWGEALPLGYTSVRQKWFQNEIKTKLWKSSCSLIWDSGLKVTWRLQMF